MWSGLALNAQMSPATARACIMNTGASFITVMGAALLCPTVFYFFYTRLKALFHLWFSEELTRSSTSLRLVARGLRGSGLNQHRHL